MEGPYRITDRLRTPLSGSPAVLPSQDLPIRVPATRGASEPVVVPTEVLDDQLVRQHATDAAAFAAVVDAHRAADASPEPTPVRAPVAGTPTPDQTAELPAAELPATELPATELPAAELPAAELPATEPPATEPPATDRRPLQVLPADLPDVPVPLPVAASALGDDQPTWGGLLLEARPAVTLPSALDVPSNLDRARPTGVPDPVFELEPEEDEPEVLPPRTWLERIAAVVFVGLLVAAAVWLAVDLG